MSIALILIPATLIAALVERPKRLKSYRKRNTHLECLYY